MIPPKLAAARRVGEVNIPMYVTRINAMIVLFVFKNCEM